MGTSTSPRGISVLWLAKLKEQNHVCPLTRDMELKICNLSCWVNVLLWLSISSLCSDFPFEIVMYILCYFMLGVYNLLFYFTRRYN